MPSTAEEPSLESVHSIGSSTDSLKNDPEPSSASLSPNTTSSADAHDDALTALPPPLASTAEASPTDAPVTSDAPFDEPPPLPPAPFRPPHPHRRARNSKPVKGILKSPTVTTSRFNFRRDILTPFNQRLAYPTTPLPGAAAVAAGGGASEVLKSVVAGGVAPVAAAAGGFWGSAMKKLSGVTAVAGHAAAGVRDLSEDPPHPPPSANATTDATTTAALPTPPPNKDKPLPPPLQINGHAVEPSPSSPPPTHERLSSLHGPAPHTPSRGAATSSPVTSSPYATIRASAAPATPLAPVVPPLSVGELKRVRFRMATLKVVYPINGPNGPLAPWEESKTKKRINMEHRALRHKSQEGGDSKGWTGEALGRLYAECCRTREEPGIERVRRAFRENPRAPPKTIDLSNELLSHGAIEALADVLSVDFGLKKLVLESSGLDDESLRPLLHSLLVSGNVPTVSLANNKRIKAKGWKLIAIFIRKARFLRYLDVSDNNIDKKAADYLVQALTPHSVTPSSPGVTPLASPPADEDEALERIPGIGLGVSERAVREDGEEKKGSATEEDDDSEDELEPLFTVAPLLKEDASADAGMLLSIRLENCGLKGQALEALAHGVRASSLKHISIRRNRIGPLGAVALAIMIRDYPVAATDHHSTSAQLDSLLLSNPSPLASSSPQFESGNTVTARLALQAPYVRKREPSPVRDAEQNEKEREAAAAWAQSSEARNKLRRQIEELPRTGSLLTLDVKGNDIKSGVTYISQVLKRNRTLKVLNLSENKIDVQGLVSIAEALKFNSTLETLDMSLNPCCGPGLEGITALRAAITVNSNLKRVFLNNTDLNSEGAIALSEFLPEAKSLIHLDLTGNFEIDIAGVMALSVSLKMNNTLRCLDLNVPPNDPAVARLSQEILQCCIRNTEQAQEEATSGSGRRVAAPIFKSAVARDLKTRQDAEERQQRRREAQSQSKDEMVLAAEEVRALLDEMLQLDEKAKAQGILVAPSEVVRDSLVQAQLAEAQLAEAIAATTRRDPSDRAVVLGDALSALLDRAKVVYEPPAASPASSLPASASSPLQVPATPPSTTEEPSSPGGFTIADSDDSDSDDPPASPSKSAGLKIDITPPEEALDAEEEGEESVKSPIESQSRSLTLEEGEVFRKGSALGTGEVDEEDEDEATVTGEELKKEILEAKVERSPRQSFSDASSPSGGGLLFDTTTTTTTTEPSSSS